VFVAASRPPDQQSASVIASWGFRHFFQHLDLQRRFSASNAVLGRSVFLGMPIQLVTRIMWIPKALDIG
jgi:hypothetical protein